MKKERWIPMLVTAIVGVLMLVGLLSNPFRFDPLFGKGYKSIGYAYTRASGSISSMDICLTSDGYLVRAGGWNVWATKLKEITFDPATFTALCPANGYWYYSPEYICQHIERAWYGTFTRTNRNNDVITHNNYVLLLDDGKLLYAWGGSHLDRSKYPDDHFTEILVLEAAVTQSEFFQIKKPQIEQDKDNYMYRNLPVDNYAIWQEVYQKFH